MFAHQVAAGAGDCKKDGWQHVVRDDGGSFRNQGDCVSYSEHHNGKGHDDGKQHGPNGGNGHNGPDS